MKQKFIYCQCGCGGLFLQYDNDFGLEITPMSRPYSMSFKDRIRYAWATLCGKPYADFIILGKKEVADLTDYLVEIQNDIEE